MNINEEFAQEKAEEWLGCILCKKSHFNLEFCPTCGQCFYCLLRDKPELIQGGIDYKVSCPCGCKSKWDLIFFGVAG
jgi:hypothetical protein